MIRDAICGSGYGMTLNKTQTKISIIGAVSIVMSAALFFVFTRAADTVKPAANPKVIGLHSPLGSAQADKGKLATTQAPGEWSLAAVREKLDQDAGSLKGEELLSKQLKDCMTFLLNSPNLAECIDLLKELPAGQLYDECGAALARRLAHTDPEMGLRWLEQITGEIGTSDFIAQFAASLTPANATKLAEVPVAFGPREKARFYGHILPLIATHDLGLAVKKISEAEFLDNSARIAAINQSAARSIGASGMEQFTELELTLRSLTGDSYIPHVALAFGYKDPVAAANWVANKDLSNSKVASGAAGIVATWLRVDSQSASKWVDTLPASLTKDHAIESVLKSTHDKDPVAARAWLDAVSSDKMRLILEQRYSIAR